MNEIIGKVRQAEQEAQALITKARDEAQQVLHKSSREAVSRIAEARKQADDLVREAASLARQEADQMRKEMLKSASLQSDLSLEERGFDVAAVVDRMFACVVRTSSSGV